MGNILLPTKVDSPLEKIATALKIVESYYGIKGAKNTADIISQANDPESDYSKAGRRGFNAAVDVAERTKLGARSQQTIDQLRSDLNATDPKTGKPLLNYVQAEAAFNPFKEMVGKLAPTESRSDLANYLAGIRVGNEGDKLGTAASKDYETSLKPYRGTQEDIRKLEGALQTKQITAQQMAEANEALMRIITAGSSNGALGRLERTEFTSYPEKFAEALQRMSAEPQDVGSRKIIEHMLDIGHRVGNISNKNALEQLDSLDSGYSEMGNETLQNVIKSKSDFFRQRYSTQYPVLGGNPDEYSENSPQNNVSPSQPKSQQFSQPKNTPASSSGNAPLPTQGSQKVSVPKGFLRVMMPDGRTGTLNVMDLPRFKNMNGFKILGE